MAPARDPDDIGELWQFIQGELRLIRQQMESSDRITSGAVARLVDSAKSQDGRLDAIEATLLEHKGVANNLQKIREDVDKLTENQTKAIAGGSVLLFLGTIAWPTVKGWLHL